EAPAHLIDHRGHIERLGHVRGRIHDGDVVRGSAGAPQLFDLRAVTESVEHDIAALRGKSARDAEPDAAGGPGDNDGLALQHRGFVFERGIDFSVADGLARIFHQDAELWRRTGRDRLGSTGAANRSFYWQDGHARYGRPAHARIRGNPTPILPE